MTRRAVHWPHGDAAPRRLRYWSFTRAVQQLELAHDMLTTSTFALHQHGELDQTEPEVRVLYEAVERLQGIYRTLSEAQEAWRLRRCERRQADANGAPPKAVAS